MSLEGENRPLFDLKIVTDIEHHEDNASISSRWFAGALEVGGVISFGIQERKTGHVSAYPFIAFRESNEEFIASLKREYGGSIVNYGSSWEWRLSGYKAADIIVDIEPYTVTRKEMVTAIWNWVESDIPDRVVIAQEMKGYNRFNDGAIEDYAHVIEDPVFIAGVLDNRGGFYSHIDGENSYLQCEIPSKNKHLLEAIQKKYGGFIKTIPAGKEVVMKSRSYITQRDSYSLKLSRENAINLVTFCYDYMKIKPYEGWNDDITQTQRYKTNQVNLLQTTIETELGQFLQGNSIKISTVDELAVSLSTSPKTALRRLGNVPEELRVKRKKALQEIRRKMPEQDVKALVEDIIQELYEYEQGIRTRLRNNDTLAESAMVGVHIINRRVIPFLPEEIRKKRQHILLSQSMRDRNEKYGNPSSKRKEN